MRAAIQILKKVTFVLLKFWQHSQSLFVKPRNSAALNADAPRKANPQAAAQKPHPPHPSAGCATASVAAAKTAGWHRG